MKLLRIYLIVISFLVSYGFSASFAQDQSKQKANASVPVTEDMKKVKLEAEQVISDYNKAAENVKYNAIKKNENLDPEVKKVLIKMEEKVNELEGKLENISFQNDNSWGKYKQELVTDIKTIKQGIQNITKTNS
ncbi:MAG: hypothetical protein HC906_07355 [Bacteroidales bacterium]|nr:hypothetical protein [Bacteroidales bacterium]